MTRQARVTLSMQLTESVVQAIKKHVGAFRAERGGMLGADTDGVICRFEPDPGATWCG